MSSLRSLLNVIDSTAISATVGVNTATKLSSQPAPGYKVEYISAQCGTVCNGSFTANYDYYAYNYWAIPSGVTNVIFEIWGAGGGGGSSCCCSRGIPGNSGAYAIKTLTGANLVVGCKYNITLGQPGNGSSGNQCGSVGGSTYITGYGLSNFCADGGNGGCSCCIACCCTWFQSNTSCACYYGADRGSRGYPGAAYIACYENHCWNKQFMPYPGGLVNLKGGWAPATQCENSGCGYCLMQNALTQIPFATGSMNERAYIPGVGGASGWTCGGGCCHGTWGTPGLVRISYK